MKHNNTCLHILNCLLALYFYNAVFQNRICAFLSAVLFCVHPIHSEAVAGIVSRADLLSASCFLIIGIVYVRRFDNTYTDFKKADFGILMTLILLAGMAVLFKENAIMILV